MSPKIGMHLSVRSWAQVGGTPAQKVTAALLRMRAQAIPLRFGDHGVAYRPLVSPLVGAWARSNVSGVNIIGAVVLAFPLDPEEPTATPAAMDPVEAAARALCVPVGYAEGLADGWDRAPQAAAWLDHINRAAYLDGYEAGMEARFRETVVCGCGTRRFRSEPTCPSCEEGST